MKNFADLAVALIYISFVSLIGIAIYVTGTAWPLMALIFTPSVSSKTDEKND